MDKSAQKASMKRVREAKAFLAKKSITANTISPRTFASASSQLSMEFSSLLRLIGRLLDGGSGMSSMPITLSMIRDSKK